MGFDVLRDVEKYMDEESLSSVSEAVRKLVKKGIAHDLTVKAALKAEAAKKE